MLLLTSGGAGYFTPHAVRNFTRAMRGFSLARSANFTASRQERSDSGAKLQLAFNINAGINVSSMLPGVGVCWTFFFSAVSVYSLL